MKLTMLGTGHAVVTECYNTCFVLEDNGQCFLVDGGGGIGLLRQLKRTGYDWRDMRRIFVTHKHTDHLLGIVWMLRMLCQSMSRGQYEGEAYIYAHDEVIGILRDMALMLFGERAAGVIGEQLHLVTVSDGETLPVIGHDVTFFDVGSKKAKQFGFCMDLGGGERLTCCGDEPYRACERPYVEGCTWLLHEAFCLYADAERYRPYDKEHSTVKDACELAEALGVKNLLLYHTEDDHLTQRKALYQAEGSRYFHGRLVIPDDLEQIEI